MVYMLHIGHGHNQSSVHGLIVVHALHMRALPVSSTVFFLAPESQPGLQPCALLTVV